MASKSPKADLRINKTRKTLMDAMIRLLEVHNFNQITTSELCAEALMSRSTFYAHFYNKYDLLEYLLAHINKDVMHNSRTYTSIEKTVNEFVKNNRNVIKNLTEDANTETSNLLCEFLLSLLNSKHRETRNGQVSPNMVIVSNICCGGLINYLLWHAKNNPPASFPVMNPYTYDIWMKLVKWSEEGDQP